MQKLTIRKQEIIVSSPGKKEMGSNWQLLKTISLFPILEKTNREATVTRTDKGIRILVYNYYNDPTGHPIPPLKMTVPSGWQITYSIEAIDPSPQTVGEGIVSENNLCIG